MVESDAGDRVPEPDRRGALSFDLRPRPHASPGGERNLGIAVWPWQAFRQPLVEAAQLCRGRLAVEWSGAAAEWAAAWVRRCVDALHGESGRCEVVEGPTQCRSLVQHDWIQ